MGVSIYFSIDSSIFKNLTDSTSMHKRKEIIENQGKFSSEISAFLRAEFRQIKKDLKKVDSIDPDILAGKASLVQKSQKIKINEEIFKLFISPKNIRPEWYAWWDELSEQVIKIKYIDNL